MKYVCSCGAEADGNWPLWINRGEFSHNDDVYARVWVKDRRIIGTTRDIGRPGACAACVKAELEKFWGEYNLRKAAEKEAKRKAKAANPSWWSRIWK
jgi:hypothetical protein